MGIDLKALKSAVEKLVVGDRKPREVPDTSKWRDKDVPLCDVCETTEKLYSKGVTGLFYRLVPLLPELSEIGKQQICKDCVDRFVRVRLRHKQKVISSTTFKKTLKQFGQDLSLENIIMTALKYDFRLYFSLIKVEWKREYKRRQYKAMRKRVISDYIDRLRERPLYPKRRKKQPKDAVTVENFVDALLKSIRGEVTETKTTKVKRRRAATLGAIISAMTGQKEKPKREDYPLTAQEYGKTPRRRVWEAEPCRSCTKVLCDPECDERVLYQRFSRYHTGGSRRG